MSQSLLSPIFRSILFPSYFIGEITRLDHSVQNNLVSEICITTLEHLWGSFPTMFMLPTVCSCFSYYQYCTPERGFY